MCALCCCLLVAHVERVFSFVASLLFDRKIISLVHSHYVCLFIVVFTQSVWLSRFVALFNASASALRVFENISRRINI